MLSLSCYKNGYELEARATPVDDRRPTIVIWPKPGSAASANTSQPSKTEWVRVNGRICFGIATPTRMGDHRSLEARGVLVEEELKLKWLR